MKSSCYTLDRFFSDVLYSCTRIHVVCVGGITRYVGLQTVRYTEQKVKCL